MNTYWVPGSRRIKAHRCTLKERFQMWKRSKRRQKEMYDPWY